MEPDTSSGRPTDNTNIVNVSFRLRLTLWNVGLLAVVLLAFSFFLLWLTRQTVSSAADRQLIDRTRRLLAEIRGENPGGPRGQGQSPGVQRNGPGRQGFANGTPSPGFGEGNGNSPFDGGPPLNPNVDFNTQFQQVYELRRPRIYNQELKNLDQNDPTAAIDLDALKSAESTISLKTKSVNGTTARIATAKTFDPQGNVRIVQLADGMGAVDQVTSAQAALLLPIVPLALLLAGAGGMFLVGRALKPIEQVTTAAEQIDETSLDRRLPVQGNDELARLSTKFNEMVMRLDRAFQKQQTLLEQQRQFTADASHELRTPLTRIKLATGSALSSPEDAEETARALSVVDHAADSMSSLVDQLLLLARTQASVPADIVAIDALPSIHNALELAALAADPRLKLDISSANVRISEEALTRIVTNLLTNAARHTPSGGTITVTTKSNTDQTTLEVSDTGEGIAPEHLPKITDRFYRIDSARTASSGGTGLGLAIVRSIVESYGGNLHITSQRHKGTTVQVTLPAK